MGTPQLVPPNLLAGVVFTIVIPVLLNDWPPWGLLLDAPKSEVPWVCWVGCDEGANVPKSPPWLDGCWGLVAPVPKIPVPWVPWVDVPNIPVPWLVGLPPKGLLCCWGWVLVKAEVVLPNWLWPPVCCPNIPWPWLCGCCCPWVLCPNIPWPWPWVPCPWPNPPEVPKILPCWGCCWVDPPNIPEVAGCCCCCCCPKIPPWVDWPWLKPPNAPVPWVAAGCVPRKAELVDVAAPKAPVDWGWVLVVPKMPPPCWAGWVGCVDPKRPGPPEVDPPKGLFWDCPKMPPCCDCVVNIVNIMGWWVDFV